MDREESDAAAAVPAVPRTRKLRKVSDDEVDERLLTPLGVTLPGGRWLPDATWQTLSWVVMGVWIALYALSGVFIEWTDSSGGWLPGFVLMWIWIGAGSWYDRSTKPLRAQRKRELKEAKERIARGEDPRPLAPPAPEPVERVHVPRVSDAERALLRTVRRVESADGLERRDVVLTTEIADVLAPLLVRVAAPGADARVRHDVETLAAEHLPRTVEDFLALPPDYAREHVTSSGRTPLQEFRTQLDLLLTGCEGLRDAVHDADVARQQQQSRFLEAKFRRSDLDL